MHIGMRPTRFPQRERGAALVIGLIIMVLLTLLGLTTMRTSSLEIRMAGHSADRNMAMQSAEAALRAAELYLSGAVIGPFSTNNTACTNGLCLPHLTDTGTCHAPCKPWWELSATWSNGSGNYRVYPGTMNDMHVNQLPRYIIENTSGSVSCDNRTGNCQWNAKMAGKSVKAGGVISDTGMYRITARGVGGQTDLFGNPVTVVLLQSTFQR